MAMATDMMSSSLSAATLDIGIFLARTHGATRYTACFPSMSSSSPHDERPPNLRHSRSSIDESLELEHALAQAEGDIPASPSAASFLDPQILADLIIQLRSSLATMTGERDELVNELAASQTREAELHDALVIRKRHCRGLWVGLRVSMGGVDGL